MVRISKSHTGTPRNNNLIYHHFGLTSSRLWSWHSSGLLRWIFGGFCELSSSCNDANKIMRITFHATYHITSSLLRPVNTTSHSNMTLHPSIHYSPSVGSTVGSLVGSTVGAGVGSAVGCCVGSLVSSSSSPPLLFLSRPSFQSSHRSLHSSSCSFHLPPSLLSPLPLPLSSHHSSTSS